MSFRDLFWFNKNKKAAAEKLSEFAKRAQEFRDNNPEYLMLLADPKTDVIFMAYGGIMAPVRILDATGKPLSIVRNFLRHARKDADIDRFLLAVDGAGFAIAKGLYTEYRRSLKGKVLRFVREDQPPVESNVTLADGSALSPVQFEDA